MLAALVLAAGQSRRFGAADKLLAPVEGRPMLVHALEAASHPAVALRLAAVSSDPVAALVRAQGFEPVAVAPGGPQSASLTAGVAEASRRGATQLMILLGDMPFIRAADIDALLALAETGAACAEEGPPPSAPPPAHPTPLPPAVFPRALFPALAAATGDRGAGFLLRAIPAGRRLRLPPGHLRDIDRPADL